MQVEDIVAAVLRLISIVTEWPVILLVLVLMFRRSIINAIKDQLPGLVGRVSRASIAGTSIEFGTDAAVAAFSETVQTGVEERKGHPADALRFTLEQVRKLSAAVPPLREMPLLGRSILWVDDRPTNIIYETNLFKELGAQVISALSTEEGLRFLQRQDFDIIISDVERTEDGQNRPAAGYELLKEVKRCHPEAKFLLYTTRASEKAQLPEVKTHGVQVRDQPQDLVETVLGHLLK